MPAWRWLRRVGLLFTGLSLGACSGEDEPPPCSGLDGSAADSCWANRAEALFPRHAERAMEAAAHIRETHLRDLVIASGVRTSGRDFCSSIEGVDLRESCQTTVSRPHLGARPEGRRSLPTTRVADLEPALQARVRPCLATEGERRATCLLARSQGLVSYEDGQRICGLVADGQARGICVTTLVHHRYRAGGDLTAAIEACRGIPTRKWREECVFRLSEDVPLDQMDLAATLCAEAGEYQDECLTHLAIRGGRGRAAALAPLDFATALERGAESQQEMQAGLRAGNGSRPGLERLFWLGLLHEWTTRGAEQGRLAAWRDWPELLPEGDFRRELFRDLLVVAWTRVHLQEVLLQEGLGAPPDLERLVADCRGGLWGASVEPADPHRAPLLSPSTEQKPDRQEGFHVLTREALLREPIRYRFSTGTAPLALHPDTGCQLDSATRLRILLLWALAPFPWAANRPVLEEALFASEELVRLSALELVWEVDSVAHERQGARPDWLLPWVSKVAEADPSERIRERAGVLRDAIEHGSPLPPHRYNPRLCRNTPPAGHHP